MWLHSTHPFWWLALPPSLAWVIYIARNSDVSLAPWRRWITLIVRCVLTIAVIAALAGFQLKESIDAMNVFFLLDRSDSIPSAQQEAALRYVTEATRLKNLQDKAGVLVFAGEAAVENTASSMLDLQHINAVVASDRTDIAAAIRLATAALPESGQKRLVLISDGNENQGDALRAVESAKSLGVSLQVLPQGVERSRDVSVERMTLPAHLKKGQVFEPKIFVEATTNQTGTLRIYRNDALLGERSVSLQPGKNLFTFSQQLTEPGFYRYDAHLDVPGDTLPQNNRATAFTGVVGDPEILLISALPAEDQPLREALGRSGLKVRQIDTRSIPTSIAELTFYDEIILSNVAAGDFPIDTLRILEDLVKDFGVGLVCIGGDQTYTAGGYRGTVLDRILPVNMELDSKKVLPKGAVALVMHGMEFSNGNQIARDCALGVLEALGPQDELGVLMWDGREDWWIPLEPVGTKVEVGRKIAGLNQGDLPSFDGIIRKAYEGLKKSNASLKHIIVFSDGDPSPPNTALMDEIRDSKITVSAVLIAGHAGPQTMIQIAEQGNGRFYNVSSADELPQVFLKETAVILKSAIYEEPFQPQLTAPSEITRGFASADLPSLKGYVGTSFKARAETPIVSAKGDPILAHWQWGLGRTVAFTSDARARWGQAWQSWSRYQQFWSQVAQWALRRTESADLQADLHVDKGQGLLSVEATDAEGKDRSFLTLTAVVLGPKGDRQTLALEPTGPGQYQARFDARHTGAYMVRLLDWENGKLRGSQTLGAGVGFSPEFATPNPNFPLLVRLAELGNGNVIRPQVPSENPFLYARKPSVQWHEIWESLMRWAVVLFTMDVGVRRIAIDPEQVAALGARIRRIFGRSKGVAPRSKSDDSLAALLAKRDAVREKHTTSQPSLPTEELSTSLPPRRSTFSIDPIAPAPSTPPVVPPTPPAASPAPPSGETKNISTTDRLLEAKRRARKQRDDSGRSD